MPLRARNICFVFGGAKLMNRFHPIEIVKRVDKVAHGTKGGKLVRSTLLGACRPAALAPGRDVHRTIAAHTQEPSRVMHYSEQCLPRKAPQQNNACTSEHPVVQEHLPV